MAIKIRAQHLEITNRRYKEKVRVGCFLVLALSAFLTLITGSKSVLFARTPFLKVDDPVSTVQALLSRTNQHYLEAINRLPDTTVSVLGVVNEVYPEATILHIDGRYLSRNLFTDHPSLEIVTTMPQANVEHTFATNYKYKTRLIYNPLYHAPAPEIAELRKQPATKENSIKSYNKYPKLMVFLEPLSPQSKSIWVIYRDGTLYFTGR